jgi:plasmid stabilization system protein ParE
VILTAEAKTGLLEAANYIRFAKGEPLSADRWLAGAHKAIASLQELPKAHPVVREDVRSALPLRHLVYHSHRIFFTVDDERLAVTVLRVHHSAKSFPEEL